MKENPYEDRPLVYTAMPKYLTGMDPFIGKFVFEQGAYPLTPYQYPMWFMDTVERDLVRGSVIEYLLRCDELWVFGAEPGQFNDEIREAYGIGIHDGVAREINNAAEVGMEVKVYKVNIENQEIEHTWTITTDEKELV